MKILANSFGVAAIVALLGALAGLFYAVARMPSDSNWIGM